MDYQQFFYWIEGFTADKRGDIWDIVRDKMSTVDNSAMQQPIFPQPNHPIQPEPTLATCETEESLFDNEEALTEYLNNLPEEELKVVGESRTEQPEIWKPSSKNEYGKLNT